MPATAPIRRLTEAENLAFERKVFEHPEAGARRPAPVEDELDSVGLWKD